MRTRLKHFDRRFDTHIEAKAYFPSPPQSPRKVRKPSKTSKIQLGQEKRKFDRIPHLFDRIDMDSGEWRHTSGEWIMNFKKTCSKVLKN